MAGLTVRVTQGELRGKLSSSVKGDEARAFLGIPYAAPPCVPPPPTLLTPPSSLTRTVGGGGRSIGDLRFAAPQPAGPWEGVRDATSHGKEPVQRDEQRLPFQVPRGDGIDADGLPDYMSEDSLTLNVYTPSQPGPAPGPLPVLFYIYGGGFNNGAGSLPMYDGTALPPHLGHCRTLTD